MERVMQMMGWRVALSCVALAAACGGRSSREHASNDGSASSVAGRGTVVGSNEGAGSSGVAPSRAGSFSGIDDVGGTGPITGGAAAGSSTTGGGAPNPGGSGAAGAGGITPGKGTPAAVNTACTALCAAFNRCPEGQGGFRPGCEDGCFAAVYVGGSPQCTAVGEVMLACLTAANQGQPPLCPNGFAVALQQCAQEVAAYRACAVDDRGMSFGANFCVETTGFTSGAVSSCSIDTQCLGGDASSISCASMSPGHSDCSCISNGQASKYSVEDAPPDACFNHVCADGGP